MKENKNVSYEMKCMIQDRIQECISILYQHTSFLIDKPDVVYDLKGRTAGMAVYNTRGYIDKIRVNVAILIDHTTDYIQRTIAHEIAHIFAFRYYQAYQGISITSHGKHWRLIMKLLGVENITRCHSYTLRPEEVRRQRRFVYKCNCKTHNVTATKHNKMLKGVGYRCLRCGNPIEFTGAEAI